MFQEMAGLGARALVLLPLLKGAPGCFAELVTLEGGFEGKHCLKMMEPGVVIFHLPGVAIADSKEIYDHVNNC